MMLPVAATLPPDDDVERAIAAMGGRELLNSIKSIGWTARYYTPYPDVILDEMMIKTFQPFRSSWTTRRIDVDADAEVVIEEILPDGAWKREGQKAREKMEAYIEATERALLGLYSYMLLTRAPIVAGKDGLTASQPGYPPIKLFFRGGALSRVLYAIPTSIEGFSPELLITFEGTISEKGLHWPQVISFFNWFPKTGERSLESRLTIGNLFVDLA